MIGLLLTRRSCCVSDSSLISLLVVAVPVGYLFPAFEGFHSIVCAWISQTALSAVPPQAKGRVVGFVWWQLDLLNKHQDQTIRFVSYCSFR